MVCPILISVSLAPGPYCFWASAGCVSRLSAAPRGIIRRTNIWLPPLFLLEEVWVSGRALASRCAAHPGYELRVNEGGWQGGGHDRLQYPMAASSKNCRGQRAPAQLR